MYFFGGEKQTYLRAFFFKPTLDKCLKKQTYLAALKMQFVVTSVEKVSCCVRTVSECVRKVSDGVRKVSDGVRKVPDSIQDVLDGDKKK